MVSKKYYAARRGRLDPDPMDFATLKNAFMVIYDRLEADLYFQEATGYDCVDNNDLVGLWGRDPEAFSFYILGNGIFGQLGRISIIMMSHFSFLYWNFYMIMFQNRDGKIIIIGIIVGGIVENSTKRRVK